MTNVVFFNILNTFISIQIFHTEQCLVTINNLFNKCCTIQQPIEGKLVSIGTPKVMNQKQYNIYLSDIVRDYADNIELQGIFEGDSWTTFLGWFRDLKQQERETFVKDYKEKCGLLDIDVVLLGLHQGAEESNGEEPFGMQITCIRKLLYTILQAYSSVQHMIQEIRKATTPTYMTTCL